MLSPYRIAPIAMGILGFLLLSFIPAAISSWATRIHFQALALLGGTLLIGSAVGHDRLKRDRNLDDSPSYRRYRSSWYALQVLTVSLWAMWSVAFFTDMKIPYWSLGILALLGTSVHWGTNRLLDYHA